MFSTTEKRKSTSFPSLGPLSIAAFDKSLKFQVSTLVDYFETLKKKLVLKRVPSGRRQGSEQGGYIIKRF